MTITGSEVQRIYRKRFSHSQEPRYRTWKVLVGEFFSRWIKPTDTVLDLGCGYGEFLNHVTAARRIGVDLNPDSREHLDPAIEFHQHGVGDLTDFVADNSIDLAFTSNLMEHLSGKREVEQMVREARRVLKPGGHFVMMGPNIAAIPGIYWDYWDHIVPISDKSLHELLENCDFEVLNNHPRFLPYTLHSRLPNHPILVSTYLKLPIAWRFFGKQFLLRARKPLAGA